MFHFFLIVFLIVLDKFLKEKEKIYLHFCVQAAINVENKKCYCYYLFLLSIFNPCICCRKLFYFVDFTVVNLVIVQRVLHKSRFKILMLKMPGICFHLIYISFQQIP